MIKKRKIKILLAGIALIALVFAGGYGFMYYQLSTIKHVDIPKTDTELGITEADAVSDVTNSDITNIALFAMGTDPDNEPYTSDAIIILSIDMTHNKIKLTSILRDTSVNIDGYGMEKIKTAYASGGPALALKTLNSNFNLDIKDYAAVQYEGFKSIIDALDGVEVNLKVYEVALVNDPEITFSGIHNLNGEQALEYCKERNKGDGDFERTERQRTVLTKVFEKIKAAGITEYPELASPMLKYVETSMSVDEILQLGTSVLLANIDTVEQSRYPEVGYYRMELSDYSIVPDLEATAEQIHQFIYEDNTVAAQ